MCYFMLKSYLQNADKSRLFEIMQFCFLHPLLLFLYLSVLLKPNFLNKKKKQRKKEKRKNTWFSHALSQIPKFLNILDNPTAKPLFFPLVLCTHQSAHSFLTAECSEQIVHDVLNSATHNVPLFIRNLLNSISAVS